MTYWAGSNIRKSKSNDFSWKDAGSGLMKGESMKRIDTANRVKQKNIEPKYSGIVLSTQRKQNA